MPFLLIGMALIAPIVFFGILVTGLAVGNGAGKPEPPPGIDVPEKFTGTWEGRIKDRYGDKDTWPVRLTLRRGDGISVVDYVSGRCVGTPVPISYESDVLTVDTRFPAGQGGCDVGDMRIETRKGDKVSVTFRASTGKVRSSGILKKRT